MRRPLTVSSLAAVLLLALAPAAALAGPDLALTFGRGFAVASDVDGAFDQGGPHIAASLLWPWEDRFRFGVMAFGTDLGDVVEKVQLTDPTDGTVRYYGSVERGHLDAWGLAWRADAVGPALGSFGHGIASMSYGYVRLESDEIGIVRSGRSAVAASLNVGLERALSSRHALALIVGGTWLSDDSTGHYGSAALEWRWRYHGPEAAAH